MLIHGRDAQGNRIPIAVLPDGTPASVNAGLYGPASAELTSLLQETHLNMAIAQREMAVTLWPSPTVPQQAVLDDLQANITAMQTLWGL